MLLTGYCCEESNLRNYHENDRFFCEGECSPIHKLPWVDGYMTPADNALYLTYAAGDQYKLDQACAGEPTRIDKHNY